MAEYNIQMNRYVLASDSYDKLYPKTKTVDVIDQNGDNLDTLFSNKQNVPTYTTSTMTTTNWSGNTYSFEAQYPNASYDISISVAPTATSNQFDAFGRAKICGSATTNVVTALGTVPSVNIPIIIKAVEK